MCEDVPDACVHTFADIAQTFARFEESDKAIIKKLDAISVAVMGNGRPQDGMASRVSVLETQMTDRDKAASRGWKITAVVIVAISAVTNILVAIL